MRILFVHFLDGPRPLNKRNKYSAQCNNPSSPNCLSRQTVRGTRPLHIRNIYDTQCPPLLSPDPPTVCLDKSSGRNTTETLEELRKTADGNLRAAISQYVIVQMIPKLSEERKLCELTQCMLFSNKEVQDVAIAWLETTILELRHR